jgi:DNA-binding response OmpR family regulator
MMPGMDGAALVTALRQHAPNVPVIASSGLSARDNVKRMTDINVAHFLPKPYRPGALLALLRTIIDQGEERPRRAGGSRRTTRSQTVVRPRIS